MSRFTFTNSLKKIAYLPTASWALYDFANTIFAMNILSLYFVLWVTEDNAGTQLSFSITLSLSMMAAAITAPLFGTISDIVGKRVLFLGIGILICAICTSLIGAVGGVGIGLAFFSLANYAYQSSNIFYDSLLDRVSTSQNRGSISGIGVGLGYLGTITGILMVSPFVDKLGREAAFIPTAILFLFFSVPCLLFVRDKQTGNKISRQVINHAYLNLYHLCRQINYYKEPFKFIIARFFYLDAINTLIVFMAVFVSQVLNYSNHQIELLLIFCTTSAIPGSLLYGWISDKIGPKKTLLIILLQWLIVFSAATITQNSSYFWAIGCLAGISLGGTWASDRAFLFKIAPPEQSGLFFGLYQLVGRFSSVVGPIIWGITTDSLIDLGSLRFRIATAIHLVPLLLGISLLIFVSDKCQYRAPR